MKPLTLIDLREPHQLMRAGEWSDAEHVRWLRRERARRELIEANAAHQPEPASGDRLHGLVGRGGEL